MGAAGQSLVLVLDDDPSLREMVTAMVESFGLKVIQAKSGKEALELLQAHPVDLAILDVCMPSPNGIEVHRQIRRSGLATRVLFMTGLSIQGFDELRGLPTIAKPLQKGLLKEMVKKLLSTAT